MAEGPLNVLPRDRTPFHERFISFFRGGGGTPVQKPRHRHNKEPPPHLRWRNARARHGGTLQAQLGRKPEIALQRASRPRTHGAAGRARRTAMVPFSLTDQKEEGLAASKSALCLVQFQSKDKQECLFDIVLQPPKQRQIGFKQVI